MKGNLPNSSSAYKVDPAWSEGLISAAKFVAMATQQLVAAASKLAEGQLKDADLIAASKAVAAATAQLVAASTAKGDVFAKSQVNLVKVKLISFSTICIELTIANAGFGTYKTGHRSIS